ncbi:hypothetical protein N5D13_07905 [Stenotrophomonas maltophilia]|nr:hypothetical protein [Stenotrophomonas maltophilia]MDH0072172.1 hypothetical protein [Stenotrophomonas maltophilia]MDH0104977.1 hypothetical protein [Stenotrophomonas maltophilia]MDH0330555.1 hypothetical protein [Stenotrophomonas maltophilia]MDH0632216.1 hypothetical protein [Stenotrophomonas maltophilia]MDH0642532.1 hypothetical protein [Stenotrophomonas maltophilia]
MANNVQTTTITIGGEVSKSLKDALSFANDGVKRLGDEAGKLELKLAAMKKSGTAYTRMRAQADALRASQEALERVEAKRTANLEKREKLGASFKAARGTLGTAVTALAKPVENASGFARQNQQIGVAANLSRAQVSALGQAILAAIACNQPGRRRSAAVDQADGRGRHGRTVRAGQPRCCRADHHRHRCQHR